MKKRERQALLKKYTPPTWHNGYDNSHLIYTDEDGTIKPKPEYVAFAEYANEQLERDGNLCRLVWCDVTASFNARLAEEEQGERDNGETL